MQPPTPTTPGPMMMSPSTPMAFNPFFSMRVGGMPTTPGTGGGGVLQQLASQHRVFNTPTPTIGVFSQQQNTPPPPPSPQFRMGGMNVQNQQYMQSMSQINNIAAAIQNATPPNFEPYEKQVKQIKQMQKQLRARNIQQMQEHLAIHMQLQGEVEDQEQLQQEQSDDEDNEEEIQTHEPWLSHLHESALQRYAYNAQLVNEIFWKNIDEQVVDTEDVLNPRIKELEDTIAQLDKDIQEEEQKQKDVQKYDEQSTLFYQQLEILEKAKTKQEKETVKRKLDEIFHVERDAKRTKVSDEYLFPLQ
jgi:hypothetical protein